MGLLGAYMQADLLPHFKALEAPQIVREMEI
jgi:hypothetical protein